MTTTENPESTAPVLPGHHWEIDPTHSEIGFTVRHLGLSKVRGRFDRFEGSVDVPGPLADATIEVSVDLSSVDTNNDQRDSHLLSSDFFAVDANPKMTFQSTTITVNDDGATGTIHGKLTVAGTTRTVGLDTEFHGVAVDAYGTTRAGFSATATLSRKDFGIDFNVPLDAGAILIGDKMTVEIEVQIVPTKG